MSKKSDFNIERNFFAKMKETVFISQFEFSKLTLDGRKSNPPSPPCSAQSEQRQEVLLMRRKLRQETVKREYVLQKKMFTHKTEAYFDYFLQRWLNNILNKTKLKLMGKPIKEQFWPNGAGGSGHFKAVCN